MHELKINSVPLIDTGNKMIVSKLTMKLSCYSAVDILVRGLVLFLLYFLINFDEAVKLDYYTYKLNYELEWRQFEYGFEVILSLFRYLGFAFVDVWMVFILLQILLISLLYKERSVFYFAIPNLYFLSQGLLGTQVRFALSVLLLLYLIRVFEKTKYGLLFLVVPTLMHVGATVLLVSVIFVKYFLNVNRLILERKNIISLLWFVFGVAIVAFFMNDILMSTGYYYYVGTKFQAGKSIQSLLYISLGFLISLAVAGRGKILLENEFLYLGVLVSIFSIIFSESSVIAGRFTLVYVLIEPFILAHIYREYGVKKMNFLFFLLLCVTLYAKILTVDIVI